MASPENKGGFFRKGAEKLVGFSNALDVVTFIWGAAIGSAALMIWSGVSFAGGKYVQSRLKK